MNVMLGERVKKPKRRIQKGRAKGEEEIKLQLKQSKRNNPVTPRASAEFTRPGIGMTAITRWQYGHSAVLLYGTVCNWPG